LVTELQRQTTRGVIWHLLEKVGLQATRFIVTVILARLLTPADFGLIGMIMVLFAIAQVFVEAGLGSAYIQKKEVTAIDANTVFFTNLMVSALMYGVVWMLAPALGAFYEQPLLKDLTRVMGLIFVINAFGIIQHSKLRRDVRFKEKAVVNLIANVGSGILAIYAALQGAGVWSIAIQFISLNVLNVAGLWMVVRWVPAMVFSFKSLREMLSFGVWMLATSILTTITDNIYILVIGKLFPAAQVGFYTKAKQFQQMGSEQLSQAIGGVAFPVLSKIHEDQGKLQLGVNRFLNLSLFVVSPIMLVLALGAEPIVLLLLTAKWLPIVPYLQVLALIGILYPLHLINIQLLVAQGHSKLNFRITILKNLLRVINVAIMMRYGVLEIIIGEVIVSVLSLIITTYFARMTAGYGLFRQVWDTRSLWLSMLLSIGLGGLAVQVIQAPAYQVLMLVILVGSIFLGIQVLLNRTLLDDLRGMMVKNGQKQG